MEEKIEVMARPKRQYSNIMQYKDEIMERKANGETHRKIGESLGLTKEQIKNFVYRVNHKKKEEEQEEDE